MKRDKITISDGGTISVPANVQMIDFEIADLFGVITPTVRANIRAILKSGIAVADLTGGATVLSNTVLPDFYGLDMIIALAFRIHSREAELFRKYIVSRLTTVGKPAPVSLLVQLNNDKTLKRLAN